MKIDDLISELEQVKKEHGNLEVMHHRLFGQNPKVEITKDLDGEKRCGLWL